MSGSREEILANFQVLTGIQDVGECMLYLEPANWDLAEAARNAMPDITAEDMPANSEVNFGPRGPDPVNIAPTPNPYEGLMHGFNQDVEHRVRNSPSPASAFNINEFMVGLDPEEAQSSDNERRARLLDFSVEYRDKITKITLRDNEPVGNIKKLLAQKWGISAKEMRLDGWKNSVDDSTILASLHLPKNNRLFLLTPNLPTNSMRGTSSVAGSTERLPERNQTAVNQNTYVLNIIDLANDREYPLTVDGGKRFRDLKQDVYSLTGIPPSRQLWDGWPQPVADDDMISQCGLPFPQHSLTVDRRVVTTTQPHRSGNFHNESVASESGSDNEGENLPAYNPAGLDEFSVGHMSPVIQRNNVPLIPGDVASTEEALENFTHVFEARYGPIHPHFYIGGLLELLESINQLPARERKPVVLYFHDDQSVSANVFASQVLCSEQITNYLNTNFVVWAWDLTLPANREQCYDVCATFLGSGPVAALRHMPIDYYPVLVVFTKMQGIYEMLQMIRGSSSLDDTMETLMHAYEIFMHHNAQDVADETERYVREQVRREQQDAYEESLKADQRKEDERQRDEKRQREEEQRKRDQESRKKEEMTRLALQIPPEPSTSSTEPLSTIRIRLPDGSNLDRRFLATEPLKWLIKFMATKGYPPDEFKILLTHPKKDLSQVDQTASLASLGLAPRAMVVVEKRDDGT